MTLEGTMKRFTGSRVEVGEVVWSVALQGAKLSSPSRLAHARSRLTSQSSLGIVLITPKLRCPQQTHRPHLSTSKAPHQARISSLIIATKPIKRTLTYLLDRV